LRALAQIHRFLKSQPCNGGIFQRRRGRVLGGDVVGRNVATIGIGKGAQVTPIDVRATP
jgi:hypothetical protein